jgi:hypothetical protein
MAQEYFINNQTLQSKIDQLLPSQGGAGAGVDLSASTQIIPIVDLTESAEGSNLREDLQKALTIQTTSATASNATTTAITNTGYWLIYANVVARLTTVTQLCQGFIDDGTTQTDVFRLTVPIDGSSQGGISLNREFVIKLSAGEEFKIKTPNANSHITISARQIADLAQNLINP